MSTGAIAGNSQTLSQKVPGSPQPFARGQGQPLTTGPFLGGYVYKITSSVSAGGTVTFNHTLRATPRHVEVVSNTANLAEYPSRVAFTVLKSASVTVKFESAQSAGAFLWIW